MAELRFSRSLYSEQAVKAAVQAFASLATLSLDEGESELTVRVSQPHPALADRLVDELANYALTATATQHVRGAS